MREEATLRSLICLFPKYLFVNTNTCISISSKFYIFISKTFFCNQKHIFIFKIFFVIKTETGHGSTQNTHTESKQVKLITEMIKICVFTLFFCSIAGKHLLIQTEGKVLDRPTATCSIGELIEGPYSSTLSPGGLVH